MQQISRMMKAVTVAVAAVMVAGAAAVVFAQGDGPGPRGGFGRGVHGRGGLPFVRALDLSEAQREQVRTIMQRYTDQLAQTGRKLREAHEAQRAAVETVPVNEALIRSTAQTVANAQTDMALLQARIHSDVWSLLTPDQQEKATQLKAQRHARMKQRFQERQERRQQRQQQREQAQPRQQG